jgi:hypothetical protein
MQTKVLVSSVCQRDHFVPAHAQVQRPVAEMKKENRCAAKLAAAVWVAPFQQSKTRALVKKAN